ncbi:MAG: aminopeptidase P family protein [Armatimonadetes bacterium]|nr:aminopeptidase P family protein [Armatimonadota bacterium]
MHKERLSKLRNIMVEKGLGALLVTDLANVFYLSGFTGSTAALVVTADDAFIMVDSRYAIQAREECKDVTVKDFAIKTAAAAAAELINELRPKSIGYEARNLTMAAYKEVHKIINYAITRRSTDGIVEKLRMVKDSHEIGLIRKACEITDAAFASILKVIKPGMSEKEVALELEYTLQKMGSMGLAFGSIVATGAHSAWPHAQPGDAILETGHNLKMDFGARYGKYCADITRTVCLGKPSEKLKEVYGVVHEAQARAIEAIKPGKLGKEVDAVGRRFIASKGYGKNFGHGLGHCLGIVVHDGLGFSTTSKTVLEPGMALTVEPGIYIEGWGGVRIEDDVLVTETGVEVITKAPKNLISL